MHRTPSSPVVRTALILIVIALLFSMSGCAAISRVLQYEYDNMSDCPVIEWMDGNPETTILQIETYLRRLEKKLIITGGRELEWADICRRCYWVNNFTVSQSATDPQKRCYEFFYLSDAENNKKQQKLIDAEVSDIISCIPESASEQEAITCIHDELVKRVTYCKEKTADHIYDLYGALVNHKAVCQGYVYAMDYILDELGIDYEDIVSETHIWSRIPDVDGCEKYLDITWDDMDEYDKFGNPYIMHDCLFISASEMQLLDQHETSKKLPGDGSAVGSNYFRQNGGIIPAGETGSVSAEIERQINTGINLVQLRFENKEDYNEVHHNIEKYVFSSDYGDPFVIWNNDEFLILSIGLYYDEEKEPDHGH